MSCNIFEYCQKSGWKILLLELFVLSRFVSTFLMKVPGVSRITSHFSVKLRCVDEYIACYSSRHKTR